MKLVRFLASPQGRMLRVFLGLVLIASGVRASGMLGWTIAAIGILPLLAGAGDLCFVAALFGYPIRGREIRGT